MLWLIFNSSDATEQSSSQPKAYGDTSDYSMTNFTMTILDVNGQASRIIKGQKIAHYPQADITKITFPIAQFIEKQVASGKLPADVKTSFTKSGNLLSDLINKEERLAAGKDKGILNKIKKDKINLKKNFY